MGAIPALYTRYHPPPVVPLLLGPWWGLISPLDVLCCPTSFLVAHLCPARTPQLMPSFPVLPTSPRLWD